MDAGRSKETHRVSQSRELAEEAKGEVMNIYTVYSAAVIGLAWVIVAFLYRNRPPRPIALHIDASGGGAGINVNSPEKVVYLNGPETGKAV
jgi:hypothetical protein